MQPLIPFFDRVTIQIGSLTLGGFGVMVVAGFLIGAEITRRKLARGVRRASLPRFGLLRLRCTSAGISTTCFLPIPRAWRQKVNAARMLSALTSGRLKQTKSAAQVWDGLSVTVLRGGHPGHGLVSAQQRPRSPCGDAVMYGFATSWALACRCFRT
jgi:hypothetical protein